MSDSKRVIRKETMWTISNITAGTKFQIDAVIETNIFPGLIKTLKDDADDVKKEAAWAISNATSGGDKSVINYVVKLDILPVLCDALRTQNHKLLTVLLGITEKILEVGRREELNYVEDFVSYGGVDVIEKIRSEGIDSEKADQIMSTYLERG